MRSLKIDTWPQSHEKVESIETTLSKFTAIQLYAGSMAVQLYSCTTVQRYHAPCKGFFLAARPRPRLLLLFRHLHAPIYDPEISYSGFSFYNHAYCAHLQALVRITRCMAPLCGMPIVPRLYTAKHIAVAPLPNDAPAMRDLDALREVRAGGELTGRHRRGRLPGPRRPARR